MEPIYAQLDPGWLNILWIYYYRIIRAWKTLCGLVIIVLYTVFVVWLTLCVIGTSSHHEGDLTFLVAGTGTLTSEPMHKLLLGSDITKCPSATSQGSHIYRYSKKQCESDDV